MFYYELCFIITSVGRLDQLIYIGLPNELERLDILQVISKKVSLDNDVNLNELSKNTNLFTGADLENLIRYL